MSDKYFKLRINLENILMEIEITKNKEPLYQELENILNNFYSSIKSEKDVEEYSKLIYTCFEYSKKINSKRLIFILNDCNKKLEVLQKKSQSTKENTNGVREDKTSEDCSKWLDTLRNGVINLQLDDINEYGKLLMSINSFEKYLKTSDLNIDYQDYYINQINELRKVIYKKINQKNSTTRK